ncbi:hypothetical protein UT300019_06900 [Clostridium sp. CTA-19]
MLIKELLDKFDNYKIISKSDKLASFDLVFEINSLPELNNFYKIEKLLEKYPKRDSFNMCIKASDDDFFCLIMKNGELKYNGSEHIVKSNNINEIIDIFNEIRIKEDKLQVTIKINKDYKNKFISIYSVEKFIEWIMEKDIYQTISFFSKIYESIDYIVFVSYDKEMKILTETFQMTKEEDIVKDFGLINRKSILNSRLDVTNIQKKELNVIPEDFNIIKYEYVDIRLEKRLNCIRDILSIIYIADISLIEDNFSDIRINGYKSSEFKIFYKDVEERKKNDRLYEIYRWIYNDGNLIDKATIARNVISLHCRHKSVLELDDESLNSMKTNYTYYLKTNMDDFLEEKKNLTISVIEEGKLLSETLYELIASMGKNLLAYFTFLATLIVSNTLTQGNFYNIFTFEVVQIIAIIILGSCLFLIYSNIKTNYKRKRITDYIEDLVSGYGVLLGEENVKYIIENVKSYSNVKKSFKIRQILISILWLSFNIILLIFLDWISGDVKILKIINLFSCK